MENVSVKPIAGALHTRGHKRGEDYDWYGNWGSYRLLPQVQEVHRSLLRDVGGESPRLLLLITNQRVGFLVGNLETKRLDHSNRVISNTLYLEFNMDHQKEVFDIVINLLYAFVFDKNQWAYYQHKLAEYAEKLYQQTFSGEEGFFDTLHLPKIPMDLSISPYFGYNKYAFLYRGDNLLKICGILQALAKTKDLNSLLFVVTGRVSREKVEKYVDSFKYFNMLALSSWLERNGSENLSKKK